MKQEHQYRSLHIAEQIRRAIVDGTLAAGTRLSSQRELAEQYSTTLMTVRQALEQLQDEGLIRSEHGVGTFVTENGLDPETLGLASFGETSATPLETRLLAVDTRTAASEIARLLGVGSTMPVVHLERIRLMDGIPVVYQRSYLHPGLAPIVHVFRQDASLYRQIHDRFGARAAISRETLQPICLSSTEAVLLECKAGTPALRSCRITLSHHNQPLVYDEAILLGNVWMMVGDRVGRRGEWNVFPGGDSYSALASLSDR